MKWRSLFIPPTFADQDKNRTAILLYAVSWCLIVALSLFAVLAALVASANILRWLGTTLFIIVASTTCLWLTHQGKTRAASLLGVSQLWLVVTGLAVTGGLSAPSVAAYVLVVLAAGLLLGGRAALVAFLVCFGSESIVAYAELNHLLPPSTFVPSPFSFLLTHVLISFLAFVFVYYFTRSITMSLDMARQELAHRRRVQQALEESEARMQVFAGATFEGISVTVAGRVVELNEQFGRLLGYSVDELRGAQIEKVIAPASLELVLRNIEEQTVEPYEAELAGKDGRTLPVEVRGRPIDYQGQPARLAVMRDLTERKSAEQRLAAETHVLGKISAGAPLGEALKAIVENIETLAADTLGSILLLDADGLHVRYGAASHLPEAFMRALEGAPIGPREGSCGTAAYLRRRVIVTDIETDPLWDNYRELARMYGLRACWSTPILDSGGGVVGTFAMYYREPRSPGAKDFTLIEQATHLASVAIERNRSENAVRESEKRFRELIESAPDAIVIVNEQGEIVLVNSQTEHLFGYARDELMGRLVETLIPGRFLPRHERRRETFIAAPRIRSMGVGHELFGLRRNGSEFPIDVSLSPLKTDKGLLISSSIRDVTERKRAEEALRERDHKLLSIYETVADVIFQLAVEPGDVYRFVFVNPSFETLAGIGGEAVIGKRIEEIIRGPELGAVLEKYREAIATRSVVRWEQTSEYPIGVRTTDIRIKPVFDAAGQCTHLTGAMHDVTERKRAELERERTQYMLRERLKELAILHRAAQILQSEQASIPNLLNEIVAILPAGWQYPEISAARITFGDMVFATPNFSPSPWRQTAEFRTRQGRAGAVEVVYLEERPLEAEGPFFIEERNLINTVAEMLQAYLERKQAERQIQRQLEQITALQAVDVAILSTLELPVILDIVLEQVTRRLGADAADILLLHSYTPRLEYAAGHGFYAAGFQRSVGELGESFAGQAVLERRIIHIPNIGDTKGDSLRKTHMLNEAFVSYFGAPLIAKGQVKGVLEVFHRAPLEPDEEWQAFLKALAGQAAIAIDNLELFGRLERSNLELALAYDVTLEGWSKALDLRDKETEGHSVRVTAMTMRLARAMGLKDEALAHVRRGALLHDVGKLGIPDSILLKPGALTEQEWAVMRQHPSYAYEWLAPITYLRRALDIPHCHHEMWDGNGYPHGLKGEAIPLAARLFAVVDVYDALTSDRPYRKAWSRERAVNHIREGSGTHFDPQVVEVFLKLLAEAESPAV